jgi:hypothetical protein
MVCTSGEAGLVWNIGSMPRLTMRIHSMTMLLIISSG